MQKIILIGNLTRDPEKIEGQKLCKLNVAVNENYEKDGKKVVEYFTIAVWNSLAENCLKYLKKGSKVCVEGKIQTRTWEKDGEKKYITEVYAEMVEFLSAKSQKKTEEVKAKQQTITPIDDDSIPF